MHPEDTPRPEQIDAKFAQIVNQSYGPQAPQWPSTGYPQLVLKPRRRWGRWIALIGAVMALVCAGVLGLGILVLRMDRGPDVAASQPPTEQELILQEVRDVLAGQSAALLSGDEAGYLAVLDPKADAEVRLALTRQFRSLREMKVAQWRDEMNFAADKSDGRWGIVVRSYVCFVTTPCADGIAVSDTVWRVGESATTLLDWEPGERNHPWQVSELVAASGERTIVATTKAHASKLTNVLKEAEQAALVADRFAQDEPPPRYVVYYAGKDEWNKWFSWKPSEWTAAVAISVSDDRYEVVLNDEAMHPSDLAGHLRHELTHASSLAGKFTDVDELWWLKEGIAEFAEADGAPIRHHPGLPTAAEVLSKSAKGFEVEPPTDESENEQVSGAYTVAFLAVRCLTDRFGERRFADFFHAVIHDRLTLGEASSNVFGRQWRGLSDECLRYVKSAI